MIGILLAAGFSRRFGSQDKLLHHLPNGIPIALASANNLIESVPTSIAVVRPENSELAELLLNAGLKVVFCREHDEVMADSLATAVLSSASFKAAQEGFIIALADMPYIQINTIKAVANKVVNGASIVIPIYQNQRRHPVAFAAKFSNALQNLHGDEGARSIIKQFSNEVQLLPTDDAGVLADIDLPADVSTLNFKS